MISVVNAAHLYDAAARSMLSDNTTYAIVEVAYSNYRQTAIGENFTSSRYFRKEDDQYVALSPYEGYQVFLGTPGL
jgi:hypothetical protein